MKQNEEIDFDVTSIAVGCDDIATKEVKDRQINPSSNLVFEMRITDIVFKENNQVCIETALRVVYYPDNYIDKFACHGVSRTILTDRNNAIKAEPLSDLCIALFGMLYITQVQGFWQKASKVFNSQIGTKFSEIFPISEEEGQQQAVLAIQSYFSL